MGMSADPRRRHRGVGNPEMLLSSHSNSSSSSSSSSAPSPSTSAGRPSLVPLEVKSLHELRCDVLAQIISYLDVSNLATACSLNRRLRYISAMHEHWRWFVLQFFGVYYEDYMRSVEVCDLFRWRRLFVYIRQVHKNVDSKRGVRCVLPQLLRPCAWSSDDQDSFLSAPSSSSRSISRNRRRRRYRGSLELADNCSVFFWENGQIVQVVRARDGKVLREIDTGQRFRRYFHRLANIKNRLFVCLNDCIKVWEYGVHDAHKPPIELPPPRRPPTLDKVGRPLELLVHRRRLILLESCCCLIWDTDTLEFVCCIQHDDRDPVPEAPTEETGAQMPSNQSETEEARALEVQWMGDLIVTWLRSTSHSLKVWTLEGHQKADLQTDSPLVQVDVARVTWISVKTLDHFILCALDARSVVSLWDSKRDFNPIYRFYCGCDEPFDLVLTQDFMAVVNDNVNENRLELCFWKLWLHPNFQATHEVHEKSTYDAEQAREATVSTGNSPAGSRFSPGSGAPGVAHLGRETSHHLLLRELRHNARPIKRFSIPDIDSYFASYRNFLNVCSFHKSGQESLSVYRSSSLKKKVFFPPAKHTKFEEWLALQVHNDGTVVVHDFRPNQVAFDELSWHGMQSNLHSTEVGCGRKEGSEPSRPSELTRHSRPCFGSRSRGR